MRSRSEMTSMCRKKIPSAVFKGVNMDATHVNTCIGIEVVLQSEC